MPWPPPPPHLYCPPVGCPRGGCARAGPWWGVPGGDPAAPPSRQRRLARPVRFGVSPSSPRAACAPGGASLAVGPVGALSIARPAGETADPLAGVPRIRGRVVSTESAFGADDVLRTEVVLADETGAEVGRFAVPGGRVGGDFWVIDGVPAFIP